MRISDHPSTSKGTHVCFQPDAGDESDIPGRLVTLRNQYRRIEQVANIFFEVYLCEGPVEMVHIAVLLCQTCANLAIIGDPIIIPRALNRLGDALFAEYYLTDELITLNASIRCFRRSLTYANTVSPDLSTRSMGQIGLSNALLHRFAAVGSEEDLKVAIQMLEEPWSHVAEYGAIERCNTLVVVSLIKASVRTWSILPVTMEDLQQILQHMHSLPKRLLPHSQRVCLLISEARLCYALFVLGAQANDLHDGIRAANKALLLCSDDAEALRLQVDRELFFLHIFAAPRDLEGQNAHVSAAVDCAERIKSSALAYRNPTVKLLSLYWWARAFMNQAMILGDLDGMEAAVDALKECILICPESHMARPPIVNALVTALSNYFLHSGRISILDEVISLQSLGHEFMMKTPLLASNIAETMLMRAQISDQSAARALISQAIRLCESRSQYEGFAANEKLEQTYVNLKMIIASRLQVELGTTPYLDDSTRLQLAREGLASVEGVDPPDYILFLLEHTKILISQALQAGQVALLLEAEKPLDEVLNGGSTLASIYFVDLCTAKADVHIARSNLEFEDGSHIMAAWDWYSRAATATTGRARQKLQACLRWASNASDRSYAEEAFTAYSHAIDILPEVVYLGEEVIGRIEALRQLNGLAAASVAAALTTGNVHSAIQFLERTRGILWMQSFQTRDSHIELLPVAMRDRLIEAGRKVEQGDCMQWTARRHAAEDLAVVIAEIRAIHGFERFLQPPLLHDIIDALKVKGGYAIILVPSGSYCDALILGTVHGYSHLRLEILEINRIKHLAKEFITMRSATRTAQADASRGMKGITVSSLSTKLSGADVLSELWDCLVRPIFQDMGLLHPSTHAPRKRVWWCPVGPLSSLPIHAAGRYGGAELDCADRYAVSSYAPTLGALHRMLLETPRAASSASSPPTQMLLIAQSHAATLPSLPHARLEVQCVQQLIPSEALIVDPDVVHGMTVEAALASVVKAEVLHLACHGQQDQDNPLNSGFDLRDGRMTLGQLMRVRTPHAQLAYLSACESAGMDENRPDEGLNLAGAMIFVGFKSVIGTLWAMDDIDGPFMAERIYQRIFKDGGLDLMAVPYAVDDAVRELRELGVPASRWATYVHIGL